MPSAFISDKGQTTISKKVIGNFDIDLEIEIKKKAAISYAGESMKVNCKLPGHANLDIFLTPYVFVNLVNISRLFQSSEAELSAAEAEDAFKSRIDKSMVKGQVKFMTKSFF